MPLADIFKRGSKKGPKKPNQNEAVSAEELSVSKISEVTEQEDNPETNKEQVKTEVFSQDETQQEKKKENYKCNSPLNKNAGDEVEKHCEIISAANAETDEKLQIKGTETYEQKFSSESIVHDSIKLELLKENHESEYGNIVDLTNAQASPKTDPRSEETENLLHQNYSNNQENKRNEYINFPSERYSEDAVEILTSIKPESIINNSEIRNNDSIQLHNTKNVNNSEENNISDESQSTEQYLQLISETEQTFQVKKLKKINPDFYPCEQQICADNDEQFNLQEKKLETSSVVCGIANSNNKQLEFKNDVSETSDNMKDSQSSISEQNESKMKAQEPVNFSSIVQNEGGGEEEEKHVVRDKLKQFDEEIQVDFLNRSEVSGSASSDLHVVEEDILEILETIKNNVVISLECEKSVLSQQPELLESNLLAETCMKQFIKDSDLTAYSDFSEKLISKALEDAFSEINLISLDGTEMKNEPLEEPLSVEKSHSVFTDSEDLAEDAVPCSPQSESSSSPNWKVGFLQIKLPSKARGRGKLKAWQKRWVVIQADEFTKDGKYCHLMLSIYHSESGNSRRHSALFWRSVSSKKAITYRSSSRTHPYAFTVADDTGPLLHLAGNSETETQEWMSAIRAILWPPNPVLQLEKVLNGNEFDVSIIDNDFSYRAGLLGTYGCLTVTNRKLILNHPQTSHVIQEWYLNTVDKFQISPQAKEEDKNKVLIMHTSRDSSTGLGELKLFCNEAVAFLKSLASTIHKVLQYHCKENEGRYDKELEEISEWLTPQPSPVMTRSSENEDYYKVPKRQVRSLLDIPNFIFDKPIGQTTLVCDPLVSASNRLSIESPKLTPSQTSASTFSQDSGISTATSSSDFLNCSHTSFSIGGSKLRRQGRCESSSSESSDTYSPPSSPALVKNRQQKADTVKGITNT